MAWLGASVASILLVLTPASAPGKNAAGSSHRSAGSPALPSQDLEIRIPLAEWSVEPTTGLASVAFAGSTLHYARGMRISRQGQFG